jgi:hypothetical protein
MSIPVAPYCGTDDVAALVPQLVDHASDFSTSTVPTKVVVTKIIGWIAARIDRAFASVGFIVPYQDISGESWDDSQTTMLELMNSMGAAGMIVGPVVKPAPAMGRDSGRSDNYYTASYKEFLQSIPMNGAGFRMNYRAGSKAEQICRDPRGPTTDHLEGYLDPTRFQTVEEYTNMLQVLRRTYNIDGTTQPWDHLQTARNALLG